MNRAKNAPRTKNQKNLFFSGVLILTFSNILIKVIGLLFKIPITNIIGDEGMGYFNLTYVIYVWFYQISTSGLPTAVSVMTSEARAKGNVGEVKRIFRVSLTMFLVIGLAGMLIMMIGSHGFAALMASPAVNWCIIAIAPTLFFICISSAIRGYFQAYQNMAPTAVSQIIEAVGKMALGIIFALYGMACGYPLPTVAALAIAGLTIGAFAGMVYLVLSKLCFRSEIYDAEYINPESDKMAVRTSGKLLGSLAGIAIPITIAASMPSLTSLLDGTIIVRCLETAGMLHTKAVAAYGNYTALAIPMFNLPPVLIYPISYSLIPLLKATITRGNREEVERITNAAIRTVMLIITPCAFGLSAMAEPILLMLYRRDSAVQAAPLLSVLAPACMFVGLLSITNAILQSHGYERKPIISMLIGSVVKLGASVILVSRPAIGIYGAPIGTVLCYLTIAVCDFYFLKKYAGVSLRVLGGIIKPMISGIGAGASARLVYQLLLDFLPGRLCTVIGIMTAVAVYVILILFLRGFTKDELELIPKGERIYNVMHRLKLM